APRRRRRPRSRDEEGEEGISCGGPEGQERITRKKQPLRQGSSSGGGECAPRRTMQEAPLGALNDRAPCGSLQPPHPDSGTPSPRNRGRATLSAGGVCFDSALHWWLGLL